MRANLCEASCNIEFGESIEDLSPTQYQTADSCHRTLQAISLAIFSQGEEYWKGEDFQEEEDPLEYIKGLIRSYTELEELDDEELDDEP